MRWKIEDKLIKKCCFLWIIQDTFSSSMLFKYRTWQMISLNIKFDKIFRKCLCHGMCLYMRCNYVSKRNLWTNIILESCSTKLSGIRIGELTRLSSPRRNQSMKLRGSTKKCWAHAIWKTLPKHHMASEYIHQRGKICCKIK